VVLATAGIGAFAPVTLAMAAALGLTIVALRVNPVARSG
jgi:hypothetical protein